MTNPDYIWMTQQAHERLKAELAELLAARNTEEASGDNTGAEDHEAVALHVARNTRIQQIHDLLAKAVVGDSPPDDGIAEPGMVVTVRFDNTDETETFLLGVRSAEGTDLEVYSTQSPLGSAIVGAQRGEQRAYTVPSGAQLAVTLVDAVPYGLHAPVA